MNYCQFRNQTIKRMANAGGEGGGILPPEYQQVEYIKSVSSYNEGTALIYIDTGVTYFADFEIECQKLNSSDAKFCGVASNSCIQTNGGKYSFYNTSSEYYVTNITATTRAKLRWQNNDIYIDDVHVTTQAKTPTNGTFKLFGAGGYGTNNYSNISVYSLKIWDNVGALIRDFIPCYRKSDNAVGLYDVITGTFYGHTGGTNFSHLEAGQDV